MGRVDRRTFLQQVGVASALGAVSAAVPGAALTPAPVAPTWGRAPCRLCGVGCGLLVGLEGGRAVAVKGDPESPVGRGFACVKGYHSVRVLDGSDRITRALVRRNGVLAPVPLSEALDLVARRIRESVRERGKDSVAIYGSAQWTIPDAYVAAKLAKGALGTNNVDSSSRLHAGSAMAGLVTSFGLDGAIGCYEDIDHADVFLLWDANLAETDPVLFSRMLDRRRRNPAVQIVEVDTRTSRTGFAASQAILHQPHAVLAIANGIAHEIVARRGEHREFVERYVAFARGRTTFEPGDDLVEEEAQPATWDEYVDFLAAYAPERVERLTGMPAATIRRLAALYADRSRRVLSVWGPGLTAGARGTWTHNALYNLHLLVGKIGSPGDGPFCATGQPNGGCAVHDAGSLGHTLPRGLVRDPDDRRRAAEIWGVPEDRIDPRPGPGTLGLFRALERGDVRVLWVQATNPMLSLPNLDRHRRAAERPDRFLVVSEAFPTPTTAVADVVLPAALWLERDAIYGNMERRIQHVARTVAPPGDAAGDAWLMIEVARRLGHGDLFAYDPARHVEQIWEEYRRFHPDRSSALPPLAELRRRPGVQWPFVDGRETRWRYAAAHDPAADPTLGAFDFYGHADHRARIWLRPHRPAAEAPDAAYPLWLVTGGVLEHWGGGAMTRRIPTLHRGLPRGYVEIHREDAAALGIRDRDLVRLVSRRAAIEAEARIDYRSQPPRGLVFAPTFDEAVPVNRLMAEASCPLSGQPNTRTCAVRLERIGGRRAG